MSTLVPCPVCQRHVRRHEGACPFCGDAIGARIAMIPERVLPTARLSRSALYAFAAATVGVAACGGSTDGGNGQTDRTAAGGGGASTGGELGVPLYGGTFPMGGTSGAGGFGSGGNGFGGVGPWDSGGAPAYGTGGTPLPFGDAAVAPEDAGSPDATTDSGAVDSGKGD